MSSETLWLFILIAAVAVLLTVALIMVQRRSQQRSAALREQFGPEYERLLAEHGDRAGAEKALISRKKRLDDLDIKLLSPEQCERFGVAWAAVQHRFVDDPSGAVMEADGLVKDVMKTRGFPVGNFEQRVADLSVEHVSVVENYRAARTIAQASAKGEASTEDQRQAMVHYRALFNDLLQARAVYDQAGVQRAHA